jgi:hypothetical protein
MSARFWHCEILEIKLPAVGWAGRLDSLTEYAPETRASSSVCLPGLEKAIALSAERET